MQTPEPQNISFQTSTQTGLSIEADTHITVSTETHHSGPHIPTIQGEQVYGPISNTVVTTFLFFVITILISLAANRALKSEKTSRLKLGFLTFIKYFDTFLRDGFGDKKMAREFFPLIAGFFVIIFGGNML
jgi:F0F1-type ATP synthase membrane subunit a